MSLLSLAGASCRSLKHFMMPSLGGRSCLKIPKKQSQKMDHPATRRKKVPKSPSIQLRKKSMFPPFESAETRALAESLSRDIIRGNPNVKWESIKGLENAIISFIYQASERRGVEDTLNG
ncbi:hypothetical protein Bca52824_070025 [Brassica carinata]|uniref:Uncharacterized protein n=1 Tax=Brassica carinata TaxID=52824 RepID=A0A8X7Q3E4_BRACI|nr:hypothetical protein Bca52824_070025 [Brassica carinata]